MSDDTATPIPAEAIEAAARAIADHEGRAFDWNDIVVAKIMLAAAASVLLAAEREAWVTRLASLCDDDWLRRRDRCMELNGTHSRHDRDAAGAWESAANYLRALLGEDYEDRVDRHDTYLEWMRGDRDRGQAERGEVPVEKRYRGWPTHARTTTEDNHD